MLRNPEFRALVLQRKVRALFSGILTVVYPTLPVFLQSATER